MMPGMPVWSAAVCALLVWGGCAAGVRAQAYSAINLVALAGESGFPAAAAPPRRGGFDVLESSFARRQLQHSRVREAQRRVHPRLSDLFVARNLTHPAAEVYVRAFKRERELEVWVRPHGAARFEHLKSYGICGLAGKPGPKRREGDAQVPEGFYFIDLFNPLSQFHLSLRINYPNRRDVAASGGGRLGGSIFIHGGCRSAGCLAISDEGIEELYWLAVEAKAAGQPRIPVHIFPARIDAAELHRLKPIFEDQPELLEFWETLRPGYEYFERHRRVPDMGVDARGTYRLAGTD
jgi:murein L,D-transpeptidase YafK